MDIQSYCLKEELYPLSDDALLSGIPGWQYTAKPSGFSFKEKGMFEVGGLQRGGHSILWGGRELSVDNNRFILKDGKDSFNVSTADILQFYGTREFKYYPGGKNRRPYYTALYVLYAVLKIGRHIQVLSSEILLDVRSFEVFLERHLGIKDVPVLGEFNGTSENRVVKYYTRSDLPLEEPVITAEIFCPKCKIVLNCSKNGSPDGNYSCGFCGESFDFKYKENKVKEGHLDKSLVCSIEGHDLLIKRKQSGIYAVTAVTAAMFLLYLFTMSTEVIRVNFLYIAVAALTLTAALSFNLKIIRVSADSVSVTVKPHYSFLEKLYSGLFTESTYKSQEISQVFVRNYDETPGNRFSLCTLTHGGDELVLDSLSETDSKKAVEILQSMEVMIEKRLGITDRNVSSEIVG